MLSALVGPLFLRPPLRTSPEKGVGRWGVTIHATPYAVAGTVPRTRIALLPAFRGAEHPTVATFFLDVDTSCRGSELLVWKPLHVNLSKIVRPVLIREVEVRDVLVRESHRRLQVRASLFTRPIDDGP